MLIKHFFSLSYLQLHHYIYIVIVFYYCFVLLFYVLIFIALISIFGTRILFPIFILFIAYNLFKSLSANKNFDNLKNLNFFKKIKDNFNIEDADIVNGSSKIKNLKFPNMYFNYKIVVNLVIAAFFLLFVLDGFVMVPAGHVAVLLDRGRGVLQDNILKTGLHVKIPFWQVAT